MEQPEVVDRRADERFRALARSCGLDPEDAWVGRYVDYEWRHSRLLFERYIGILSGQPVLEFGCNVGATAIILAVLGARVTAVDLDESMLDLARANAARYGVAECIRFTLVDPAEPLPFASSEFAAVSCNSVLEYVRPDTLPAVQAELGRVLRPGGLVLVLGTSNRLWPREVHSKRWLVNYLPRRLDALISPGQPLQRGVSPCVILQGFPGCRLGNCDEDVDRYLAAKVEMGGAPAKLCALRAFARLLRPLGLVPGVLSPSICVVLRKPTGGERQPCEPVAESQRCS